MPILDSNWDALNRGQRAARILYLIGQGTPTTAFAAQIWVGELHRNRDCALSADTLGRVHVLQTDSKAMALCGAIAQHHTLTWPEALTTLGRGSLCLDCCRAKAAQLVAAVDDDRGIEIAGVPGWFWDGGRLDYELTSNICRTTATLRPAPSNPTGGAGRWRARNLYRWGDAAILNLDLNGGWSCVEYQIVERK